MKMVNVRVYMLQVELDGKSISVELDLGTLKWLVQLNNHF